MKRPPFDETPLSVVSMKMMGLTGWSLLLVLAFVADSAAYVYSQNGQEDVVTVVGTLDSADTGIPIAGGHVIVLNPGISPTGYAEDPSTPNAVFGGGESDVNGRFQVAPSVLREQRYGVIVIAPGYLGKVAQDKQFAGPDDPDVVDLGEIRMQSAT
jgi:hypothetical protein